MQATVANVIEIMESLAPPWLAEDWDNAGLQIGNPQLPASRIWIALDPVLRVIKAACKNNVDMLITHHPLIFSPLKRIDFNTPEGAIIQMAIQHQMAVYSAHTNYDIVRDGVNDILGRRLRLQNMDILHRLADLLLEKETVMGKELDELIHSLRPGIKLHTHEPDEPDSEQAPAGSEPT